MEKKAATLTYEERMRRLLIHFYEKLCAACESGEKSLMKEISTMDAAKDCINRNEDNMIEWTITKTGKLRFR